jgi:cystathionine gamma-lyase
MHSATKWISGHADVVLGVLATNCPLLHARLSFLQNAVGAVPSPFDCYLAHRGIKTLHLRAERASISAAAIAQALESSPYVISVSYPGLASHPQRKLVLRQHRHDGAGGGIVAFRIQGGNAAARRFCLQSRLFTLAESFGGVQSLVEVPGPMTHVLMTAEERAAIGVVDDLIRLSCGVEDTKDLVEDVLQTTKLAVIEPTVYWEGPVV